MRKLNIFNFISIDGYYKGVNNDINWHRHGGDESKFSEESLKANNVLLFGRVTYEMMVGFWTSPAAKESLPNVAEGMNKAEKIIFSRTLKKTTWENSRLISDNMIDEVRKLKQTPGNNLTVLGSGSIITQLAGANLIDSYQLMIDPVALGDGTAIFSGMKEKLNLKLIATKVFKSGVILLSYENDSEL